MILRVPPGAHTFEMSTSTIWFDDEGILYSQQKEIAPATITLQQIKADMERFRKITGGKKVCIIIESNSRYAAPPRDLRDVIAEEIGSVTTAMAIISSSPLSRMAANLFFSFKPPAYPFKMCSNEKDAKEWIRQYL